MPALETRRRFLAVSTVAVIEAAMASSRTARAGSPKIEVLERRLISWKPPLYHGWPTLVRRKDGELLLVFSGGREKHVCPFGRVELMRSKDNGLTWGWPQVLCPSRLTRCLIINPASISLGRIIDIFHIGDPAASHRHHDPQTE